MRWRTMVSAWRCTRQGSSLRQQSTTGAPSQLDPRNVDARAHLAIALRQLLAINPNQEVIKRELVDVERPIAPEARRAALGNLNRVQRRRYVLATR